jgi:hypothetical protein
VSCPGVGSLSESARCGRHAGATSATCCSSNACATGRTGRAIEMSGRREACRPFGPGGQRHRVASRPPSNRACGSPAHGSPTSFTGRHTQSWGAPFR